MTPIPTLIVDDNKLQRLELSLLLEDFPQINLIGEAESADEARKFIAQNNPELVFLDVEMPRETGFELVESLDQVPDIIFTTAHEHYAAKAYELSAIDYIVKPIESERLNTVVSRVIEQRQAAESESIPSENPFNKYFIKDGDQCWFIELSELSLIESEGDYIKLYIGNKELMLNRSLSQISKKLPENIFYRANRKQIFNVRHVKKIEPWFTGGLVVYMENGIEVQMSRRASTKFRTITAL